LPLLKFGVKPHNSDNILQWDKNLSVGIAEMDQQHQMIISMLEEYSKAVSSGQDSFSLSKIVNGLKSYIKEHFVTEEKYFEKYDYPWSVIHKAEHQTYLDKLDKMLTEFKDNSLAISRQIIDFSCEWMKNHILKKDKTYSYFFIMKGLK
jgi:hemerythrin-like metal-binding protein